MSGFASPPSNRLEKLKGNLQDFYAIRINDRWRLIFKWKAGDAHEVRIVTTIKKAPSRREFAPITPGEML